MTYSEKAAESNRAELMSGASLPMSPSDARRRLQSSNSSTSTLHPGLRPQGETVSESPFRAAGGLGSREAYALDEHSFIQNTESRLDDFIAQGREVLDNLVDQRNILKGTQRRILDTANTLGLSKDVISWIEKRRCVSPVKLGILLMRFSRVLKYAGQIYLLRWSHLHLFLFLSNMALPWIGLNSFGQYIIL